jgi:uncharacterized protein (TIGR02757 family)
VSLSRPVRQQLLRERLDHLVETFDISTITPDPLQLVLRYRDPLDQEVAALIAAAFAYGRADIVVANIGAVLDRMIPAPYAYLLDFKPAEARRRFKGFAHRFQKTPELVAFLGVLADAIATHGSLGALFRACYRAEDSDIGPSLTRFVDGLLSPPLIRRYAAPSPRERGEGPRVEIPLPLAGEGGAKRRVRAATSKALHYLLTSPRDGSACKRMNLFLRWMVRPTPPDLGLWDFIEPSKLVVPLDTHVHRITTFLGLNRRKTADWKAARGITDRLARFREDDPVRYDFAICRLGILDLCSRRRRKSQCDICLLRDVCRFPVV